MLRILSRRTLLPVLVFAFLLPSLAAARVTRIEIDRHESFADGAPFGDTGAYEKLIGTVYFALDPTDEHALWGIVKKSRVVVRSRRERH